MMLSLPERLVQNGHQPERKKMTSRISRHRLIPVLLAIISFTMAGCSSDRPKENKHQLASLLGPDFPLDLQSISLSDELSVAIHKGVAAFQSAPADDSRFASLHKRDQLFLLIERPETRERAGDELYDLWRSNPTDFLWAGTAIRFEYLLHRKTERDKILSQPALSDTLTAIGAFARGLRQYSYESRGRYFFQAAELPGLTPLNKLLLLQKTAMVESRRGNHFKAVRQLLAALPEVRQLGGPSLEIRYWSAIALYLKRADRLDDAVHALAMGMFLAEKSGNEMYQGLFRISLAGLLNKRQEETAALAQYEAAIEFSRQKNLPWVMLDALDRAAGLSTSVGRPAEALVFDRQSLAQSLAMGDSLNAPRNMMNISDDFLQMGVLDSCVVYHKRARTWVDGFPNKNNMARLPFLQVEYYCHIGQYDAVDSLLALATDKSNSAGLALDEVELLLGMINRGLEMSKPDMAYKPLKRLQQLRPVFFNQNPEQNIMADVELATADLLMALGDYLPASQALDAANTFALQSGAVEKRWHYHRSAGKLAALRGDFATADKEFSLGLQLARQSNNPGRIAESHHLLGQILLLEGKTKQARTLFVALDQDPAFGGSFRTRLTNLWYQGQSWRIEGDLPKALSTLEKAVALSTPFSPPDVMAGVHLDLGRTLMQQNHPAQAFAHFQKTAELLKKEESGSLHSFLDDTRRHLSEAMIAWYLQEADKSPDPSHVLKSLHQANQTILQVSMGASAEAVTVENLNSLAPDEGCTALFFLGQKNSYLWIGHRGQWNIEVLPPAKEIKKMIRTVMADLQHPDRKPDPEALAQSGSVLLGPVMPFWEQGQKLTLISDGFLNNIPWTALVIPQPYLTRVLEHGPIAESPGLMEPESQQLPADFNSLALLAMGYNGSDEQEDQLRNAEKEARIIAENWSFGSVNLLVGAEASWSAEVLEKLSRVSVLHLASHARVREGYASDSFLLLAHDDGSGPLTAQSIRQLSWSGELVFLSSCEVGRSHSSGQGMMGLAGAFLEAGVKAVLASSAEVSDEAGLYFAQRFYHHWSVKKNREAALQAAQLDMVNRSDQFSHPFYWAHYRLIQR